MSEFGTGLQNATGIRDAVARAGYSFVEASDMRTALGRFGTPGDIAGICLFLASPLAAYVTGANLVAHGGGERPAFLEAVDRVRAGAQGGGDA